MKKNILENLVHQAYLSLGYLKCENIFFFETKNAGIFIDMVNIFKNEIYKIDNSLNPKYGVSGIILSSVSLHAKTIHIKICR